MHRRGESCSILENAKTNPFRRFLNGEAFSIESSSPIDLKHFTQTSQNAFPSVFCPKERRESDEFSSCFSNEKQYEQHLNETLCQDEDESSSSGCSSASVSEDDEDDIAICKEIKIEIERNKIGNKSPKSCDAVVVKKDLNQIINNEENFVDDFEDVPNEILNKLPEGLRDVMAVVRETTNNDIRLRNKQLRITMVMTADQRREHRRQELRAKMLRLKLPPPIVIEYVPPPIDYLWKLIDSNDSNVKAGASQPENNSNILVIDNTNVTLRKKGTSQINEVDNTEADSKPEDKPSDEQQAMNESDELTEYNTHNYWHISPDCIDVEKELFILNNPPEPEPDALAEQGNDPFIIISSVHATAKTNFFTSVTEEFLRILSEKRGRLNSMGLPNILEPLPVNNDSTDNVHTEKLEKLKAKCVGPSADPKTSFFNQSIVPHYLIEYFVSMEHFADNDFNLYCVYNFPAVVLTLKKE